MLRRVGYIINVFPKLSETFIANELIQLHKQGFETCVISLRKPAEELRHGMIEQSGLLNRTQYNPDLHLDTLRKFHPQILHAHFATEPADAARKFSRELGIPFTFTAHGYDIHRKPPPDFSDRARAAARVITVSRANADHIQSTFHISPRHLQIIPCGVDLETFKPTALSKNDLPLILCVARHVQVKNLALLLRACALLREQNQTFHCVMLGDGPCRSALESLRDELGLQHFVSMPGAAEQKVVLDYWQKADIGVLTSDNEGLPVCLMEAGACALPVVATSVGGVPELVKDEITGFLVPPRDPVKLACALSRLLNNPELRGHLGKAGRVHIAEHFSLQTQVERMIQLWNSLLNQ